jgi:Stealth protein CR2, conserved region 2/Stealth protein CR3, conserved region 3
MIDATAFRRAAAGLREALLPSDSPLRGPIDVVLTWVDYSDPRYCEVVYGREPACQGDFVELKYVLRSYEALGFPRHLGRIHVVHSDLHPPPAYLRSGHPQLTFVKHSQIVRSPEHLPLRTREAIVSNLHRIPGLSEWYLFSADDNVAMQPWETLSRFLWQSPSPFRRGGGRLVILTEDWIQREHQRADVPGAGWLNGVVTSTSLLARRFGRRRRHVDAHAPHLMSRRTMAELEATWPEHLERTARSSHEGHVSVEVLHDELMVDTQRAVRRSTHQRRAGGISYGKDVHTNALRLRPPVTREKVDLLRRLLADAERDAVFVNLQGPGISDEYEDAPAYRDLCYGWLDRRLPARSSFEV